jgi:hypothetical protein
MIYIIHGLVVLLVIDGAGLGDGVGAGIVSVVGVLLLSTATIIKVNMVIRMKRIMHSINLSVIIVLPK